MKGPWNHKIAAVLLVLLVFAGCQRSPQARRNRYMASGKELLEKKDFTRAVIQFRNAAVAMPRDAEVFYELGLAYLGAGDVQRGYASLKRAVELNPSYTAAQFKIAQLQSATGDPQMLRDSEKRLNALLQDAGPNSDTLNALAFTEMQLGNMTGAAQHLEQLLATSPAQLISSVLLANAKLAQKDVKGAEVVLKTACEKDPKSADPVIMLGKFYITLNRYQEAEQQFQKALQLNPTSSAGLSSLGLVQYAEGKKQEAEQSFRRLSGFADANYNYLYGLFLLQEKRNDEAVHEFERLARQQPDDRVARTRLIATYSDLGRMQQAETAIATALKKNPRDLSALMERGEIYLKEKKYTEAETDFNQVLHMRSDAPEIHYLLAKLNQARGANLVYRQELGEALRLNPGSLPVRLELAQDLLGDSGAKSALEVLDGAPSSQKDSVPLLVARNWALWALGEMAGMRKGIDQGLAQTRSTDLLVQDGLWKLRAGDPLGARKSLNEALDINPSDLAALQALTRTYFAEKNSAAALRAVKQYASKQPKSAPIQQFLGVMLTASGDQNSARAAFAAAAKADPKFAPADMSLVQLDAADGRLDEARARLRKVLASNDNNMVAHLWLGNIQERMGDHTAAIQQFRNVVQANPSSGQALNNLAYLLAERNDQLDDALKYAQRAVEVSPNDPNFTDTLGWILYRKGLYSVAVRYLEQASAHSESVVWKYHLAMAYAKDGNTNRAKAVLRAALQVDPRVPEAKAAQEMIGLSQ